MCPAPAESCPRLVTSQNKFGPANPNKYVDAKTQLADILTKGSFVREQCNHLLRLFNIMDISKSSSEHFSPIGYPQTLSKRLIQEDERVVAQTKTSAKSSFENFQSFSNSAEFECVSKPGESFQQKIKFGLNRYGEARRQEIRMRTTHRILN